MLSKDVTFDECGTEPVNRTSPREVFHVDEVRTDVSNLHSDNEESESCSSDREATEDGADTKDGSASYVTDLDAVI